MAKNDELKERIAESRHNEKAALTYGTCGFGALSAALAYGAWQGFVSIYFIAMMVILIIGFVLIGIRASHQRQKRRDWIEQLDNPENNTTPDTNTHDTNTKEPTLQEIMNELHKIQCELNEAEGRDRVMAWIAFTVLGATIIIASLVPQNWWAVLGGAMFIAGGIGIWKRVSPW